MSVKTSSVFLRGALRILFQHSIPRVLYLLLSVFLPACISSRISVHFSAFQRAFSCSQLAFVCNLCMQRKTCDGRGIMGAMSLSGSLLVKYILRRVERLTV